MADTIQLASPLQYDSIVDGPGVRMVVWTQGCMHHCIGCHNPQTWNPQGGTIYAVGDLVKDVQDAQLQTGITFSGGEPFLQAEQLVVLAEAAKAKKYNIWAFTGFLFEELLCDPMKKKLLTYIDVLVDGRFEEAQKDYRLVFKGSANQRIIDVQASLVQRRVVRSQYDDKNMNLVEG